jgi:hypothetical protein
VQGKAGSREDSQKKRVQIIFLVTLSVNVSVLAFRLSRVKRHVELSNRLNRAVELASSVDLSREGAV